VRLSNLFIFEANNQFSLKMDKLIRQIEQISFNAWPSLKTILYDNWVIRISDGVTRRANSINPIFESSYGIEEKISFCEKLYFDNNLPVVYKLTNESSPKNLDELLEAKGYYFDAETSVQTMNLNGKFQTKQLGKIIIYEKIETD
jgi:N-acetylglutamate synthase